MDDRINSWADLRALAARILDRLNADERLAVAAAANPLLAVERLGYVIAPEAQLAIADRLRLGPDAADALAGLRMEISRLAGRQVDPDDPSDLRRLIEELDEETPAYPDDCAPGSSELDVSPPRWRLDGPGPDPLEHLRDRHPVMGPLLQYRHLAAQEPPFAPPQVFAALLTGELSPAVSEVTGRLQRRADVDRA